MSDTAKASGWRAWLGLAALVAALPIALLGSVTPSNEYRAWGLEAVDCDGPLSVMLFAVPGLLIYGAGAIAYGFRYRKPLNVVVAGVCLVLCLFLGANLVSAVKAQRLNDRAPEACR
jgi:hypothetical protein